VGGSIVPSVIIVIMGLFSEHELRGDSAVKENTDIVRIRVQSARWRIVFRLEHKQNDIRHIYSFYCMQIVYAR